MEEEKPILKIVGGSGNAFAILGAAKKTAQEADWSKEKIDFMMEEATSGDYDHLLSVMMKYFEVE